VFTTGRRGDRACRLIGLIGVAAFLVAAFSPLADRLNLWLSVPPDLVRADAIVVLGGSVSRSGVPSLESQRRTNRGIELYQRGLAPLLVLLGGSSGGGPTEADVRAEQARLHGIRGSAILTETGGNTTREEALRVKALLQPRGARSILLVSNAGHLVRARPLFERAGFEVHPAPSDPFGEAGAPESRLSLTRTLLKESLGWLYYRIAGYI
jgi:uncharacterized SAM-binding protein YcdF (DUF218 family)